MQDPIKITVLGSGTSVGIPTIGCHCEVCSSTDPRNSRLRPSILVSTGNMNVLIDTTPDLRQQALRFGIEKVDAILLTHPHADHIMGLDDVRPFNFKKSEPIPIFGSVETIAAIRRSFAYIFDGCETQSSRPKLVTYEFNGEPIPIGDARFEPVRLAHGKGVVHGFRFANAAYLTDHSDIPLESLEKLHKLDVLFLDALRYKPHPTHSTVEQSLKWVEELEPRRAFFTHISHDLEHVRTESLLPSHVRLAYDGLEITTGGEG